MLLDTSIRRNGEHVPWHADEIGAGRAQHDRRGNIQGDGWRLRRSGHAEFSLPRGRQVARATPCFHSIDFYVTAQPSLILSLYAPRYCLTASAGFGRQFTKLRALSRLRRRYGSKKESYPRPLRPPPPHEKAPSPSAGGGAIFKQKSSFIQPARRCPGFPGAHCSADRPKPRRSTARCSSHRPGAGRHS